FEGGFRAAFGRMGALAMNPALLDDIEMLDCTVIGRNDAVAFGIEAQLAVFHQKREMRRLHLDEGRILAQELHGSVNVLQYGSLASFGVSVTFAHGSLPFSFHGGPWAGLTQLDVSLVAAEMGHADPYQPRC